VTVTVGLFLSVAAVSVVGWQELGSPEQAQKYLGETFVTVTVTLLSSVCH